MRYAKWTAVALILALVAVACADDEEPTTTTVAATTAATAAPTTAAPAMLSDGIDGEIVKVRVAEGVSYDDEPWIWADEFGIDTDLGIDIEIIKFTDFPLQGLIGGDFDMMFSCQVCVASSWQNFPEYRDFMITNQFKGFILVGRPGMKTWFDFVEELGGDEVAATEAFIKSLEGMTLPVWDAGDIALVEAMMNQGGLTADDLNRIGFPDLPKAGLAFMAGEGDIYFGTLSQVARMVYDPETAKDFIVAAPFSAFGPGGLWFSTMGTTQTFLDEKPEAALRAVAAFYRAVRYLHEKPDVVIPLVDENVAVATGGTLGTTTTHEIMTQLNYFPTAEDAKRDFFTAGSPLDNEKSIGFLFDRGVAAGEYSADDDWRTFQVSGEWLDMLLNRSDLMEYVNSPLE